jgi:hypothetical protein
MAPPDVQTAVVVTRLRVMKVDEFVDEWADLEVQQRPVPKPQKGQVGDLCTQSGSVNLANSFSIVSMHQP